MSVCGKIWSMSIAIMCVCLNGDFICFVFIYMLRSCIRYLCHSLNLATDYNSIIGLKYIIIILYFPPLTLWT